MVARRFVLHHNGDEYPLDYDTDHGLEMLQIQIFSLTLVPPEEQKILVEEESVVVDDSLDLGAISEKLRLVSIEEADAVIKAQEISDEELARRLQAKEDALMVQQYAAQGYGGGEEFRRRVEPYMQQVLMYEDPVRQEAARKSVPVDELEEKALVSLAKEVNFSPSKDEKDHAFLLQLLFWFKQSFRWVNAPPCDSCSHETSHIGMGAPLPSEIEYGGSRVELYRCNDCSSITRFPRYNDPYKLLETKRGRCGEWANCFTLYCRAFGYEARLILDFTDHVWTECFSNFYGRWMHLDPCEGVYDNPLLYEKGWNKRLNYAIALSKDGVVDVTRRYTRKWPEVLSRRIIATEDNVSSILWSITKKCRTGYSKDILSFLEDRDQKEAEELGRAAYLDVHSSISLPGRQSGSVEWRRARSELGLSESESLSSSSCPIRKCVDAHVSKVYDACAELQSYFRANDFSKSRIVEVLEMIKKLMADLKKTNFKNRTCSLDLRLYQISGELTRCIEQLLSAMSLKGELGNDGVLSVAVSGSPVQSSLALPVTLDAVDEIISHYKRNDPSTKDISFPKGNRLYSGSVRATGEELPIGIATAAFDGTRLSKWEEPNGAKGCCLIYKLADGQTCELESYDLMSANDAPERDPMDWVLEGSADGGSTWTELDKQTSQVFEGRFLRKTFLLDKTYIANAFRFRFLRVRDPNATSRFQIGSIDFYGKSSWFPLTLKPV